MPSPFKLIAQTKNSSFQIRNPSHKICVIARIKNSSIVMIANHTSAIFSEAVETRF